MTFYSPDTGNPVTGPELRDLYEERDQLRQQLKQAQAQIDYLQPTCVDAAEILTKYAWELKVSHTIAGSWDGVGDIKDEFDYMLALAERMNVIAQPKVSGGVE